MKKTLLMNLILLLAITTRLLGQEKTVSGKVTSFEDGSSLPGVSVTVKGTTNGVTTNADGTYKIPIANDAVLVFSFIGLSPQEIAVGNRSRLDVQMRADVKSLNELVVSGYREQSQRKITGSISTVSSRAIDQVPLASFDQILQGRAPGLLIQSGSGQPGRAASVIIRGRGSISGGTDPLYVLDGVPINAQDFATLNPNDFESVSVLKDASSTAQYGSRGGNGVIVITSKKGKAGKTKFSYNFQQGFSQLPENKSKLTNTNQKIDLELETGIGLANNFTSEELEAARKIETNWEKELFRQGRTVSHELTASGGSENTNFFISANYFSQEGTLRNTNLDRYTGRLNISHNSGNVSIGTNFSLGFSSSNLSSETNAGIGSPLNAYRWANPYFPARDSTGGFLPENISLPTGQPNPVRENELNQRLFDDVKIVGNAFIEYRVPVVPGLSVKTNWGIDYLQRQQEFYFDKFTYIGNSAQGNKGSLTQSNRRDARFVGTTSVTYSHDFGTDHSLTASLYQEIVYREDKRFGFTGYGLNGNIRTPAGITAGSATNNFIPNVFGGTPFNSALSSVFGDVNYGFKDRYFLSLGLRRDGSSRFGSANRFATFYSVGASWLLHQEKFMGFSEGIVSNLKLKASFGTTGNQEGIGDFASRALFSTISYGGVQGQFPSKLENPTLRWEQQQKFNVGLDFGLFNERVSGTVEFYNNLTKDLFLPTQLSRTTGFSSLDLNVGQLRNRGLEVSLTTVNVKAGSFEWNTSVNFTLNRNRIVKLIREDQDQFLLSNVTLGDGTLAKVGKPLFTNYVVPYVGVNPANGDALYLAQNGSITNQYNPNDARPFGTWDAPYFGGFTNTFIFKGFSASIFFVYVAGNELYNNERTNIENPAYILDNVSVDLLRAWRQPGDITDVPRINNPFQTNTTRYLEDGSFLRLRNVLVAYTLPSRLLAPIKLTSVRIFAQAQNILTFTKYDGSDPENDSGSVTGAKYPTLKQVTFGVNVGF